MAKGKVCTHCGFTWDEFLTRGIFGCAKCYNVFRVPLQAVFAVLHGHLSHIPSSDIEEDKPVTTMQRYERLAQLREKLSDAVRQERFEDALSIKKQIKEIEAEHGSA
ncbi:MAG: UvrB/UvrC motif-containing protein [Fibrobacteria bacterium]|nr:UvrB/UvrC motif-containing protein [Fibrobacteria bacterium]